MKVEKALQSPVEAFSQDLLVIEGTIALSTRELSLQ